MNFADQSWVTGAQFGESLLIKWNVESVIYEETHLKVLNAEPKEQEFGTTALTLLLTLSFFFFYSVKSVVKHFSQTVWSVRTAYKIYELMGW